MSVNWFTTSSRKVCKCDLGLCCAPSGLGKRHQAWGQYGDRKERKATGEANIRTRLPYDLNWGRSFWHVNAPFDETELEVHSFEVPFLHQWQTPPLLYADGYGNQAAYARPVLGENKHSTRLG